MFTVTDINNAEEMFGSDVGSLHGQMFRRAPASIVTNYVVILPEMEEILVNVEVTADIIFLNKNIYLSCLGSGSSVT